MDTDRPQQWLEDEIEMRWGLFQHARKWHENADPSFIPVHLTGGIGDVIMALDLVKMLQNDFEICVFTKHLDAFRYFYGDGIPAFKDLPNFTWSLEVDTMSTFQMNQGFHGFLLKDHDRLFLTHQKMLETLPGLYPLLEFEKEKFYLVSLFAKKMGWNRRTMAMACLGYEPPKELLRTRANWDSYITIHDGYDHSYPAMPRSTKQWDLVHWGQTVKALKELYPAYKIVQLGSKTSRKIPGVDECLLNETTITQAFDILKDSALHLDGDSGLVHAATQMKVPCVVLWGPTPHYFYGYPQNTNLTSSVCKHACYGFNSNWMELCAAGFPSPKCLDEITPEIVIQAIKEKAVL